MYDINTLNKQNLESTSFTSTFTYISIIWIDANYCGSKAVRVPIPKIHINEKINTRMEKNIKNQC
jgi:hypothetical protein